MTSLAESESSPSPAIDLKLVRKFRWEIHALGALWIIIGTISTVIAKIVNEGHPDLAASLGCEHPVVLILMVCLGQIWGVLGVITCYKQMWAVYVALVLTYLSMAGQLVNFNLYGGFFLAIAIFQAHRVIYWSKKMLAAGIPLTSMPQ